MKERSRNMEDSLKTKKTFLELDKTTLTEEKCDKNEEKLYRNINNNRKYLKLARDVDGGENEAGTVAEHNVLREKDGLTVLGVTRRARRRADLATH